MRSEIAAGLPSAQVAVGRRGPNGFAPNERSRAISTLAAECLL